jgi:hypothetical protein
MMAEINAKMDSNQAEMSSTVCAMRSELKESIQHEMKAVIQPIRSELDEMTACNKATETEPDPRMMQSIEEHQEIPMGEATVMPVGEPRKRRRVRNLATGRHQKMEERTRGYCGPRRKLAAACRKVSCHAKVAWRKRNLIRKIRIQACSESQKELALARREMMHHAKVARSRRHNRKRYDQANVALRTPKGRMSGMRRWKDPECNNGMRDRGIK